MSSNSPSATLLALLIDCVEDYSIFMLDPEGRVATWNPGAERIKGWRSSEIIGRHFSCFFPPEDVQAGKPARLLESAARAGRHEDEDWRVRKDGTRFWANVVLTAVRDDDGKLIGFGKITRDLTERKLGEDERVRLAQAEEAIRLRDEFLSVAAHELRTPLTTLVLQVQSVLSHAPELEPGLVERVEAASRSAWRLAQLIDTLLDLGRATTGQLEVSPEPFELGAAVDEVVDLLRELASRAGCELSLQIVERTRGKWDRGRVQQVVTSLVANAIKYAPGTPIEVVVAREAEVARLVVSDRGPGIPEADLQRVFRRFEGPAPRRTFGGLGLGLFLAREIVEAHGGTIVAENRAGGGAALTVRLPLAS